MGSIPAQQNSSVPSLRHRSSISTLHLPSQVSEKSIPRVDLELPSLRPSPPSYISLKDLLPFSPSGIQSPTGASSSATFGNQTCFCCGEIPIRNRLVKQAAWAYLQPMSYSPDSSGRHFFSRVSVGGCLGFFKAQVFPFFRRAFNLLLGLFSFARKTRS
ncbi:hypothetical protein AAC387_Pa12g0710 [Persea americana]